MHSEKNPDGTSYSNFPRPAPSLTADDMLKEIAPPKFISAKLSSWSWSSLNQTAGKKVLSSMPPKGRKISIPRRNIEYLKNLI